MPKKLRSLLLAAGIADILAAVLAFVYLSLFAYGLEVWDEAGAEGAGALALVIVIAFWVGLALSLPGFSLGNLVTGIAGCYFAARGKMRNSLFPWTVVGEVFSVSLFLMALFNFMMAAGIDYFTLPATVLFACLCGAVCLLAAAQLVCKGFLLAFIRRERKGHFLPAAASGAEGEPLPPA